MEEQKNYYFFNILLNQKVEETHVEFEAEESVGEENGKPSENIKDPKNPLTSLNDVIKGKNGVEIKEQAVNLIDNIEPKKTEET